MAICQCVDSVVQQEPLIVESAESPFLGLNRIGVEWYECGEWIFSVFNQRHKFKSFGHGEKQS